MKKLQISQILVKDKKLVAINLSENSSSDLKILIEDIKQKQAEVLKLKEVDQESLRKVIQL